MNVTLGGETIIVALEKSIFIILSPNHLTTYKNTGSTFIMSESENSDSDSSETDSFREGFLQSYFDSIRNASLSSTSQSQLSQTEYSEVITGPESENGDSSDDENHENDEDEPAPEVLYDTDRMPTPESQINWNWTERTTYDVIPEPFDEFDAGWTFPPSKLSALDSFLKVFTEAAMKVVMEETNRFRNFKPIQKNELFTFFAIRMIMGIDHKPEQKHYWSLNSLLRSNVISNLMKSDRYFEILRYLHFNDNTEQVTGDRLVKIRNIWEICTKNFETLLKPGKNISVDESLIIYKGRLFWKQYMPQKRSRFGFKTFSIVDGETGFVINSIIYSGKGHQFTYSTKEFGYGGAIVLELTNPYLGKNHVVYTDNYFSSPNLAHKLLQQNTYLCSTVQKRRKNMPLCKKMKKGEIVAHNAENILVEYWRDKKIVSMISTSESHKMEAVTVKNSSETKLKPQSVINYNKNARGIDQTDQMMHYYTILRKSMKWYKKLFFHLFDLCVFNSYKIFSAQTPNTPYLKFRLELVSELILHAGKEINSTQNTGVQHQLRLSAFGRHHLGITEPSNTKKHRTKRCTVCSNSKINPKVRKETIYFCKLCNVPLCAVPCMEIYHTKVRY